MSDLVDSVRYWAGWAEKAYMHCSPEFIMVLVSMPDDKMGRFQIACPHMDAFETGTKPDGSPIMHYTPSCRPEVRAVHRFSQTEACGMEDMGAPWLVRATQGHLYPETIRTDRLLSRVSMQGLRYFHSLTHCCSASAIPSILKNGIIPGEREIMCHPYPPGDSRHVPSSRTGSTAVVVVKMQAQVLVSSLYASSNAYCTIDKPIPPHLLDFIYLNPRPKDHKGRSKQGQWERGKNWGQQTWGGPCAARGGAKLAPRFDYSTTAEEQAAVIAGKPMERKPGALDLKAITPWVDERDEDIFFTYCS